MIALLVLISCSSQPSPNPENELVVFAASSLTNAFMELASEFEIDRPDVEVVLNFASSSQLATQMIEGARADIFASANQIQMKNVVDAELIDSSLNFTANQLTLIVPADNPKQINGLVDLAKPGLTLILATPSTPIRVYSDQIIRNFAGEDFAQSVYGNLVSEESNVRQVVTKIALGEGDVGIVYTSDLTPDIAEHVTSIPIPPENNLVSEYPIGVLTDSDNPVLAQAFIDFILSTRGQEILTNWGFSSELEE
jgi:molybdate transport system substrate-binding protein